MPASIPASCTPAATMATRRSCLPPPAIWPKQAVSSGTLRLIFQPAEEDRRRRAQDDLRKACSNGFPVDAVFGLHNWPGVPTGNSASLPVPPWPRSTSAVITHRRQGWPWRRAASRRRSGAASASFITALQSVVSRNVDPQDMAVVTVGSIHARVGLQRHSGERRAEAHHAGLQRGGARQTPASACRRLPAPRPRASAPRPRSITGAAFRR